jgi:hypothetical protein
MDGLSLTKIGKQFSFFNDFKATGYTRFFAEMLKTTFLLEST